jgi:hypothetical protein
MSWESVRGGGKYSGGIDEDKGGFSSLYKEKRKVAPSAVNYKCQKCLQVRLFPLLTLLTLDSYVKKDLSKVFFLIFQSCLPVSTLLS